MVITSWSTAGEPAVLRVASGNLYLRGDYEMSPFGFTATGDKDKVLSLLTDSAVKNSAEPTSVALVALLTQYVTTLPEGSQVSISANVNCYYHAPAKSGPRAVGI